MDWGAPPPSDDGLPVVEVYDINQPIDFNEHELEVVNNVDPLGESNTFGIDIYTMCLETLSEISEN